MASLAEEADEHKEAEKSRRGEGSETVARVRGTSPSVTGHLLTICFSAPAALVQKSWQLSRRSAPYFWLLRKRQIWQLRQKLPRSDPVPHSPGF